MQNNDVSAKTNRPFGSIRKYILILALLLIAGVAILVLTFRGSANFMPTPDPTAELAAALEENRPVFIEFYASRCPACRKMEPLIMALQQKYGRQIRFIIADTGNSGASLARECGIMSIPAYILINSSGEKVGGDLAGYQSAEKLTALLEDLLEN